MHLTPNSSTHMKKQVSSVYKTSLRYSLWLLVCICCCLQAYCPIPQKGLSTDECLVQPLDFDYLSMGATIRYQGYAHRHHSVYVNFRIKKGRLIWFSVLGPWSMEILRGIATPAGITLLNRMQKTCAVYDYATLGTLWPGPWDYALLQALLLGELAHTSTQYKVIQKNTEHIVIQQQKEAWTLTHFIHPHLRKVEKLVATAMQGSFVAVYTQFKPGQGGLLGRQATLTWYNLTAPTQPTLTISLKGRKVQWPKKPLHFPFSIPTQYEKK